VNEFNTEELVEEIENLSGNNLRRKKDLSVLLSLGYKNNQREVIEELSFTSKYVQGLFRVLNQGSLNPDVQNIDQIKSDISLNLGKVKDKIKELIENADGQIKRYYAENYLELSQKGLLNLTELMNDLEWTKKYLNQLKRKTTN
jgi:hypothetical protein